MNSQKVVAFVLAAFVAVSVGYLVAKEVGPLRSAELPVTATPEPPRGFPAGAGEDLTQESPLPEMDTLAAADPAGQVPSAPELAEVLSPESVVRDPVPAVGGQRLESRAGSPAVPTTPAQPGGREADTLQPPTQAPLVPMADPAVCPDKVIRVTYFSTSARCVACVNLENMTRESLNQAFAGELASGCMEFRMVMVDRPENRHLIGHYRLFTKSVVVSESLDGQETRWKNLDMVWHLLRDPGAFRNYIATEVREFAGSA